MFDVRADFYVYNFGFLFWLVLLLHFAAVAQHSVDGVDAIIL